MQALETDVNRRRLSGCTSKQSKKTRTGADLVELEESVEGKRVDVEVRLYLFCLLLVLFGLAFLLIFRVLHVGLLDLL